MDTLSARRDAAQAAHDRFVGCALKHSTNDCARLAAFTARKLGRRVAMPKAGSYKTLAQGRRVLAKMGYAGLEDVLDANFPRIPYAAALPGDIIAMPTPHEGWVALAVALGNGRILGFQEDPAGGPEICKVMSATFAKGFEPVGAWNVAPCRR